jgi:N-acetylglucosamine-6-phosphate deacetylase
MALMILQGCNQKSAETDESLSSVEGIFYLDNKPVSVKYKDGVIERIDYLKEQPATDKKVYVAPGFIDLQINGFANVGFSDEGLTVEGVREATEALWREGVTTYFPTIITHPHERIKTNFAVLAKASEDPEIGPSVPGFFLEGPYISPVQGYRGAHLEKWVRDPNWEEFLEYYEAAKGKILKIAVAPEMPGTIDFIKKCVGKGIVVSLAHTNATADDVQKAVDAGATVSTHLGNGCANMIHRHHNPIWPQLAHEQISPTIIVDGHHLTREEVITFYKVKGPENTMLVSDVTKLAGMPPGEYSYGGKTVVLTADNELKFPAEGVLAGAATPMRTCIGKMMDFTGCSLAEAINMSAKNQARVFGLKDRGVIEPGKKADFVLFTMDDNGGLVIEKTYVSGKLVYSKE